MLGGGGGGTVQGDGSEVKFPGGGGNEMIAPPVSAGARIDPGRLENEREEDEAQMGEPPAQTIARLERELAETREALAAAERRGEIDRELSIAGAVDLETARVMTENVIARMRIDDVAEAVGELRRTKPFLFEGMGSAPVSDGYGAGVMSGMAPARDHGELDSLAESARASGDRRELARYLRARRGG